MWQAFLHAKCVAAGSYRSKEAATTEGEGCIACQAGRYSDKEGLMPENGCVLCLAGRGSDIIGAVKVLSAWKLQSCRYSTHLGADSDGGRKRVLQEGTRKRGSQPFSVVH